MAKFVFWLIQPKSRSSGVMREYESDKEKNLDLTVGSWHSDYQGGQFLMMA
jgi:hypothetical protein